MPIIRALIHPGEILQEEFLAPAKVSQTAFAKHLGISRVRLNELISGKRGVTAETAILLGRALNTSAEMWLALQTHYDLLKAEEKMGKKRVKTHPCFREETAH